jgi:hypothetical protein
MVWLKTRSLPPRDHAATKWVCWVAGHGVDEDTLTTAARSCGYHAIRHHSGLRRAQTAINTKPYITELHCYQRAVYRNSRNVLVLDGSPFYAAGGYTGSQTEER